VPIEKTQKMNERKQNLLKIITAHYIKTAQPVSSKLIAEAGDFDLSSATIRSEMVELEEEGYIYHPHTSAGRVPTEKGYQFFVDNFLPGLKLAKKQQELIDKTFKNFKNFEPKNLKDLAKNLAELSDNAVFVAFAANDFYYTGLSNLFDQPEFSQQQVVYNLSRVIDHFDQAISKIFNKIDSEVAVAIGSKNPFGADCSSVLAKYQLKDSQGILGILGPVRMDYQTNFNLVKYSQQVINKLGQ